jgi:hypothetical protein
VTAARQQEARRDHDGVSVATSVKVVYEAERVILA